LGSLTGANYQNDTIETETINYDYLVLAVGTETNYFGIENVRQYSLPMKRVDGISKYKAVTDLPKFSFKGFFAWLIWLFIHILPITGFRDKVKLSLNWF
jgi:NADH dehydrogenase FAD-containing subunit